MSELKHTPCSEDPDLFFSHNQRKITRALAACASCTLIDICREEALSNGERYGIWGGMTEEERRDSRRRGTLAVVQHEAAA